MRIVVVIGVVMGGLVLGACSSTSSFIADGLPAWAGGLPEGTPPRPGTPGYEAYWKSIRGDEPLRAAAAPAPAAVKAPRKPKEPIDDPIH